MNLNKIREDIYVLNRPKDYHVDNSSRIHESLLKTSFVNYGVIFVSNKDEFVTQMMTLFPRLQDTSTLWVVYPKETSKEELANLHLEFDWYFLGQYRMQPIKQVSVDSKWYAMKIKKIIDHG